MPRVIKPVDTKSLDKDLMKDYFDRHTPVVICEATARRGEKLKVKVRIGTEFQHPDDYDHFISYLQLWNRETFLAAVHFTPGVLGSASEHVEVDFYIVPKVSMNLSAMSSCTKHGLWQSEERFVRVVDPDTGNEINE
jgi:superoxide reductase